MYILEVNSLVSLEAFTRQKRLRGRLRKTIQVQKEKVRRGSPLNAKLSITIVVRRRRAMTAKKCKQKGHVCLC